MEEYEGILQADQPFTLEDNFITAEEDGEIIGIFSYMVDYWTAYAIHVVSLDSKRFGMAFYKFITMMQKTFDTCLIECTNPLTERVCAKRYPREGETFIATRRR